MRRKPLFCAERIDINGDGELDEAGFSTQTNCTSSLQEDDFSSEQTYWDHVHACYNDHYVPFTLAKDPHDGSVTVWIDPPSQAGARRMTLSSGDQVLGRNGSILTYDPSRLIAKKTGRGILGLAGAVGSLLNGVKEMGWAQRAYLAGLVANYLAGPSPAKVTAGIRYANSTLDSKDQLTPAQIQVLTSLVWKYRDRVVRVLTDPHSLPWLSSWYSSPSERSSRPRTTPDRYVAALQGATLRSGEQHLFPLNLLTQDEDALFEGGGLVGNLGITLSTWDLVLLDRYFSEVRLAVDGPETYLHRTVATLKPVSDSSHLGEGVWVDRHALEEACTEEINGDGSRGGTSFAVPAVITGYYEFTQGDLPQDEGLRMRNQAVEVLLENGASFLVSTTRTFFPIEEVPAEDVDTPWLWCGKGRQYRGCPIRVGTEIEVSPLPDGRSPDRVTLKVTQIDWDEAEREEIIIARDAQGLYYRALDQYEGELIWESIPPEEVPEPPQPLQIGDLEEIRFEVNPATGRWHSIETEVRITQIAWSPYDRGGYWEPWDRGVMYLVLAQDANGVVYEGWKYVYGDMRNANSTYHKRALAWSNLGSEDFTCGPAQEQSE